MSKAIFVMDMPESCESCRFLQWVKPEKNCLLTDMNVRYPVWWVSRHDLCPLREVPRKIDYASHFKEDQQSIDFSMGYTKGYNTCIDEILGGGK